VPILLRRTFQALLVLLPLAKAWPDSRVFRAVLIVDLVGLALIYFSAEIDDLTFGSSSRGRTIDAHTPPFMIAAIGWLLLWLMAALVYWPKKS